MEVAVTPPIFDQAELDAEALELWRFIGNTHEPLPMAVTDLMGFAYICTLEIGGIPETVERRIDELPEHHVAQYYDAVRRSRAPGA
jgi:hypothetical protein